MDLRSVQTWAMSAARRGPRASAARASTFLCGASSAEKMVGRPSAEELSADSLEEKKCTTSGSNVPSASSMAGASARA